MSETPLIVSSGEPFERGRHLGTTASDRVNRTVDAYFDLFAYHAGLAREQVLSVAEMFVPVIESYAPALLGEMRGIAAGSGRDPLEIVAINARTELLHGVPHHECTSVAVAPPASADGHVWVGQNWDWYARLTGTTVLWAIRKADGPDVVTFTEAGIVGKIGMNAAGVGLCVNLLLADSDNPGPAVPMHVILRRVLDVAQSASEAVQIIAEAPRCTSANHLLADASGAIADVEATPAGTRVIEPKAGLVTHANHCVAEDLVEGDRGARETPESVVRAARAESFLSAPVSLSDVRTLLADHVTAPWSICLHVQEEQPKEQQGETIASILMDLTAGTLDLADGRPCSTSFRHYRVQETFKHSESVAPVATA